MPRVFGVKNRLFGALLVAVLFSGSVAPATVRALDVSAALEADQAAARFDVQAFLEGQPGVLDSYVDGSNAAAQVVEGYAAYYNLDARILLALLELVPHLITDPAPNPETLTRPFGAIGPDGFSAQIDWTARELRAGFGPYEKAPEVRFPGDITHVISLDQDPSLVAVQRFLAQGRSEKEWIALKDAYVPLFRRFFGAEPETVTPVPRPVAARPFLRLPWTPVYPRVPGDPLAGKPVNVVHSSYFDHVFPTVDRGSDNNNFIVTYQNRGNLSYNTHDGHDYYFSDRPIGTPIVAAADGIAYAWTARGNGVVIRHLGAYAGYETVYWHLDAFDRRFRSQIDTGAGIPVQAGDYLGTSGKSGFVVGGAHLHFEVRHNGKQVDPYGWHGPGKDPCAAWTAGCEESVWLWHDSLRGSYDFSPPVVDELSDREPPVGTLSVGQDKDISLLAHFDEHPVQSIGLRGPLVRAGETAELAYEQGVFGQALRVAPGVELTYPIDGNVHPESSTLSLWANVPAEYPSNGTDRHYLIAASNNPGDSANGVYTSTLALRRQLAPSTATETPQWNFWTVDDAGVRHDLVVADTLSAGWHHFAIIWDRSAADGRGAKALYIDGTLRAREADAPLPSFVGDRLEVGRWTAGYGHSGVAVDELAVFRRNLTMAEIARLANKSDFRTGVAGPLGQVAVVGEREVELDTNAIDAQGGVVTVRLRRNDEPWGEPTAYHDNYGWSIEGEPGLHTFAVEYRDRADNVTVVTTTVQLASAPIGTVELIESTAQTATLALASDDEQVSEVQLANTPDFAGAPWRSMQDEIAWKWTSGQPHIVYVRFRTRSGLIGPTLMAGEDSHKLFVPALHSGATVTPPVAPDHGR